MDKELLEDESLGNICYECVGEPFLSNEIKLKGEKVKCSYCNKLRKSYNIELLAEKVEKAFNSHYYYTSANNEEFFLNDLLTVPVIEAIKDAADIPDEAAIKIQEILGKQNYDMDSAAAGDNSAFDSGTYYGITDYNDDEWQDKWTDFENSLKSESRFFNRKGMVHLTSVFKGIQHMKSGKGLPLIAIAGPNKKIARLYRTRVFQSDDSLKVALENPDRYLGPPPSKFASVGRMNAAGISVFYGASDPELAIAEVRPPVGSRTTVACFDLIRDLNLLDLTALNETDIKGSIFDESYVEEIKRTIFLRNLSRKMSLPVMPDDALFQYLPTQAISDFLASDPDLNLDGIIFPSTQFNKPGNYNVVLFNKASKVAEVVYPKGTEISVSSYDYYDDKQCIDYSVHIEIPRGLDTHKEKDLLGIEEENIIEPTLSIDPDSIHVHVIEAVNFITDKYPVKRRTSTKIDTSSLTDI